MLIKDFSSILLRHLLIDKWHILCYINYAKVFINVYRKQEFYIHIYSSTKHI